MINFVNNSETLENHIENDLFMSYEDYCEIKLLSNHGSDSFCYKCEKELIPLTYIEPELFYQPCWNCLNDKVINKATMKENIESGIKNYYSKLTGDRYLQLFVVDNIYFDTTLPHEYSEFKKVLKLLNPPPRDEMWFLDWNPGYPKIISTENISGIKIVNLSSICNLDIKSTETYIKVGDYKIELPEQVEYSKNRQYRYSLFSTRDYARKSKRVKVGNRCYKLYKTFNPNLYSILKITKNGAPVAIREIKHQDFVIMKLAIMRNKKFIRTILDIILELLSFTGTLRDAIFLKNTVILDPDNKNTLSIVWTTISKSINNNSINLSIL